LVRASLPSDLSKVEARPRLDDGVDVERAELAAIAHDVERGGVDREVDAEALAFAYRQVFLERVAIIFARQAEMDEADAALVEELAVGIVRIDDDEALLIELEVALDQRQGAPCRSIRSRSSRSARRYARAGANGSSRQDSLAASRTSDAKRLREALKAMASQARQ
jgi:hypothetical protein